MSLSQYYFFWSSPYFLLKSPKFKRVVFSIGSIFKYPN
ncbi:Hypothetical protein I595_43 [Croceitalea dokdonensis DOKDO 023]|uniref:Uncharacterized protein n=1 Tax=Croceitalea dokdonensis DOKDO 023 TaxID=1300341 RepID=A0A0P7AYE6_9FLAO|nr:Hypothetical protein I595_43 [Croceitalea dokdonensis DOKDO 023]